MSLFNTFPASSQSMPPFLFSFHFFPSLNHWLSEDICFESGITNLSQICFLAIFFSCTISPPSRFLVKIHTMIQLFSSRTDTIYSTFGDLPTIQRQKKCPYIVPRSCDRWGWSNSFLSICPNYWLLFNLPVQKICFRGVCYWMRMQLLSAFGLPAIVTPNLLQSTEQLGGLKEFRKLLSIMESFQSINAHQELSNISSSGDMWNFPPELFDICCSREKF